MKIIIVLIGIHLVYSEYHSLITTYTGIRGLTETPEFIAVTTLDKQQIDYYDSDTNELIPKQDWMKKYTSGEMWKEDSKIRQEVHQIYRRNIHDLMERFNQTRGVHVYQRMYGCEWDDQTGESHGIDQYGYDGEDYVMLDIMEIRYITPVPQGEITVQKWNNNRAQLQHLQKYYKYECVKWLKQFLASRKAPLETKAPKVFLLQRSPSSPVECFATGFYPSAVTVTWLKGGQELNKYADLGETLPNEDGTFQSKSLLKVSADNWKNVHDYFCEVEHMGITTQKTLIERKIEQNNDPTHEYLIVMVISFLVIGLLVQKMLKPDLSVCQLVRRFNTDLVKRGVKDIVCTLLCVVLFFPCCIYNYFNKK